MWGFLKENKAILIVVVICTIGIFIIPFLVLKTTWFFHLGVSKSNEIGDTIGGILSPFIGLVSIVLIYLTIQQQIKANEAINSQFEKQEKERYERTIFEYIKERLLNISKELENIKPERMVIDTVFIPLQYDEFIHELSKSALFQNSKYRFKKEDESLLLKAILDYNSLIKLFNEKVNQEKAFITIINDIAIAFWELIRIDVSSFLNPETDHFVIYKTIESVLEEFSNLTRNTDNLTLIDSYLYNLVLLESRLKTDATHSLYNQFHSRLNLILIVCNILDEFQTSLDNIQQGINGLEDRSIEKDAEELRLLRNNCEEISEESSAFNSILAKRDIEIIKYVRNSNMLSKHLANSDFMP